jgi:hypothetical protein
VPIARTWFGFGLTGFNTRPVSGHRRNFILQNPPLVRWLTTVWPATFGTGKSKGSSSLFRGLVVIFHEDMACDLVFSCYFHAIFMRLSMECSAPPNQWAPAFAKAVIRSSMFKAETRSDSEKETPLLNCRMEMHKYFVFQDLTILHQNPSQTPSKR